LLRSDRSTLFLHGVCMLCECIYGDCAHGQHVRRTLTLTLNLTLTHTITTVLSGNVVHVRTFICETRQKQCGKGVYRSDLLQSFALDTVNGFHHGCLFSSPCVVTRSLV